MLAARHAAKRERREAAAKALADARAERIRLYDEAQADMEKEGATSAASASAAAEPPADPGEAAAAAGAADSASPASASAAEGTTSAASAAEEPPAEADAGEAAAATGAADDYSASSPAAAAAADEPAAAAASADDGMDDDIRMRPNMDTLERVLNGGGGDDGESADGESADEQEDDDDDDDSDNDDSDNDGGGGGGAVVEPLVLAKSALSDNTPVKGVKPRRKGADSPWRFARRVHDLALAMRDAGYDEKTTKAYSRGRGKRTHVCTKCWLLIHVGKDKRGRWVSSNVACHMRVCPNGGARGETLRQGDDDRQDDKTETMFQAGGGAASASGAARSAAGAAGGSRSAAGAGAGEAAGASGAKRSAFEVDTRARALAMQARYYVYGRQRISKATFDDPTWRDALSSAYQHGGGLGAMASLTAQGLSSWVIAEYDVFKVRPARAHRAEIGTLP